jgi:hypothetical protein
MTVLKKKKSHRVKVNWRKTATKEILESSNGQGGWRELRPVVRSLKGKWILTKDVERLGNGSPWVAV